MSGEINNKHNLLIRSKSGKFEVDKIPYSAILIVRLLLMKEKTPDYWRIFNHLESLLDEWKKMGTWRKDQEDVLKIIRDDLEIDSFESEDILKVNCLFVVVFDLC